MLDYTKEIKVKVPPEVAFKEISLNMSRWWSNTTSEFKNVGDVGEVSFEGNKTYWTFWAEKLEPPNEIILRCISAMHVHEGMPESIQEEWLNTELFFQIEKNDFGSKFTVL